VRGDIWQGGRGFGTGMTCEPPLAACPCQLRSAASAGPAAPPCPAAAGRARNPAPQAHQLRIREPLGAQRGLVVLDALQGGGMGGARERAVGRGARGSGVVCRQRAGPRGRGRRARARPARGPRGGPSLGSGGRARGRPHGAVRLPARAGQRRRAAAAASRPGRPPAASHPCRRSRRAGRQGEQQQGRPAPVHCGTPLRPLPRRPARVNLLLRAAPIPRRAPGHGCAAGGERPGRRVAGPKEARVRRGSGEELDQAGGMWVPKRGRRGEGASSRRRRGGGRGPFSRRRARRRTHTAAARPRPVPRERRRALLCRAAPP
jgi:hypothetical protein